MRRNVKSEMNRVSKWPRAVMFSGRTVQAGDSLVELGLIWCLLPTLPEDIIIPCWAPHSPPLPTSVSTRVGNRLDENRLEPRPTFRFSRNPSADSIFIPSVDTILQTGSRSHWKPKNQPMKAENAQEGCAHPQSLFSSPPLNLAFAPQSESVNLTFQ